MLFSIFPPYLVAIKLTQTLLFILIIVPVLSRWVFRNERVDGLSVGRGRRYRYNAEAGKLSSRNLGSNLGATMPLEPAADWPTSTTKRRTCSRASWRSFTIWVWSMRCWLTVSRRQVAKLAVCSLGHESIADLVGLFGRSVGKSRC